MKRFAWIGMCIAVLGMGVAGCDWETGSDATNWSSAYNWVNFSGTYRGVGGGLLITDYTTTPSIPGVTNVYSTSQSGGTMPARETSASGRVSNGNIVPGSFMVTVGNNATLADTAKDGLLTGNGSGSVDYSGGTWSIKIDDAAADFDKANSITVSYSYTVSRDGTSSGGARPGSTGAIYSFNVTHRGQHLSFTDSNGATYTGVIGELRTASGAERGDEDSRYMPVDGDTMIATFEIAGRSAAGMGVRIVGSLQGTVAAGVFTNRRITGTWIEAGGKTGDINGQTATIPIVLTPEEEALAEGETETAAE